MKEKNETLLRIIDEQIAVERDTLKELIEAEESAGETAVQLIYLEMRLDTWKHIKFLEGVKDLLQSTPCDEWSAKVQRYVDRVKLERKLKSLRERENSMANLLDQALEVVDDPIAKVMLLHLRDDENRHVEDLEEMIKIVQAMPLQPKKPEVGSKTVC